MGHPRDELRAREWSQWRRFLELVPISGAATGVDLSSAMLAVARSRGAQEGLTNVRFERADAQVHPFDRAAVDLEVLNRHATPDGVLLAASSWLVTAAV